MTNGYETCPIEEGMVYEVAIIEKMAYLLSPQVILAYGQDIYLIAGQCEAHESDPELNAAVQTLIALSSNCVAARHFLTNSILVGTQLVIVSGLLSIDPELREVAGSTLYDMIREKRDQWVSVSPTLDLTPDIKTVVGNFYELALEFCGPLASATADVLVLVQSEENHRLLHRIANDAQKAGEEPTTHVSALFLSMLRTLYEIRNQVLRITSAEALAKQLTKTEDN